MSRDIELLDLCEKFGELVCFKTNGNDLTIDSFENSTILLDNGSAIQLRNFLNEFINEVEVDCE